MGCAAPRSVLLARAKVPFGSLVMSCSPCSSLAPKILCLAAMVPGGFMNQCSMLWFPSPQRGHSGGTLSSSLFLKAPKVVRTPNRVESEKRKLRYGRRFFLHFLVPEGVLSENQPGAIDSPLSDIFYSRFLG